MSYSDMLYRLAVALWAGGNAIFTLLLTPILFKTENRDTAARIVGNIFPAYFKTGLVCGLIAIICRCIADSSSKSSIVILVVMLVLTSFQAFYIEPKAADVKKRIVSFETTSRDDSLRREFSRLHGVSAVCNLAVLAGGVALVFIP